MLDEQHAKLLAEQASGADPEDRISAAADSVDRAGKGERVHQSGVPVEGLGGATFKEVPVPFVKRQRGRETGTRPQAILAVIRDIVRWWVRWVVLNHPSIAGGAA